MGWVPMDRDRVVNEGADPSFLKTRAEFVAPIDAVDEEMPSVPILRPLPVDDARETLEKACDSGGRAERVARSRGREDGNFVRSTAACIASSRLFLPGSTDW